MTEPKDKNEAQRLDEILARAVKHPHPEYKEDEADYITILEKDGLIHDVLHIWQSYRITKLGQAATLEGHNYTALFEAAQREKDRLLSDKRHKWANTIIAVAAFALSLFLTFCR